MINTGDILAGKYEVERVLGKGGMGYVVAAFHAELGQRVAVKFLMPELCNSDEQVTRFLREARAAVRIRSEHVARVIDVGKLDNGAPYMVMEYLEGHDLSQELEARNQLPIDEAVDCVLQATEAIAEAHSLGIVHRDLKPSNLFLAQRADGSPLVKVLDFGISKAMMDPDGAPAASLTGTQALLGSPNYMSPEQVRRPKLVDVRTDVWALGVILYELLSGRQPFIADNAMSVLAAVVSDPTPSLRESRPDVPVGLEAIIDRCLAKMPPERYQSVADLADALAPFAPLRSIASISRISGVLRGNLSSTPGTSTPPTRKARADDDTMEATPALGSGAVASQSGSRGPSQTAAEWGKETKTSNERSRVGMIVAVCIAVGIVTGLGFAALSAFETPATTSVEPDQFTPSAAQPGTGTAPAQTGAKTPAARPTAGVDLSSTLPDVATPASSPAASGSTSPVAPPRRPTFGRPTPRPVAQPKSSTALPPTTPGVPDPLEGRR